MICIFCKDETGNDEKVCENCKYELSCDSWNPSDTEPYRPIVDEE